MSSLAASVARAAVGILAMLPLQAALAQVTQFDLDGDGRITRREFVKGRELRFTAYDRNGDLVISPADFPPERRSTPLAAKVGRAIASADMNRDGKVTRGELGLNGTPLFDRADTDGNGIVERAEIARLKAQLTVEAAKR